MPTKSNKKKMSLMSLSDDEIKLIEEKRQQEQEQKPTKKGTVSVDIYSINNSVFEFSHHQLSKEELINELMDRVYIIASADEEAIYYEANRYSGAGWWSEGGDELEEKYIKNIINIK